MIVDCRLKARPDSLVPNRQSTIVNRQSIDTASGIISRRSPATLMVVPVQQRRGSPAKPCKYTAAVALRPHWMRRKLCQQSCRQTRKHIAGSARGHSGIAVDSPPPAHPVRRSGFEIPSAQRNAIFLREFPRHASRWVGFRLSISSSGAPISPGVRRENSGAGRPQILAE